MVEWCLPVLGGGDVFPSAGVSPVVGFPAPASAPSQDPPFSVRTVTFGAWFNVGTVRWWIKALVHFFDPLVCFQWQFSPLIVAVAVTSRRFGGVKWTSESVFKPYPKVLGIMKQAIGGSDRSGLRRRVGVFGIYK
ncbi:hypothetical protein Bca4012_089625 [Brassica carinata]